MFLAECNNKSLNVKTHDSFGFSAKLELMCEFCKHSYGSTFSSTRDFNGMKFEVNCRFTKAYLAFGKGHAALKTFPMILGMPAMDKKTFSRCLDKISIENIAIKAELLKMTSEMVF